MRIFKKATALILATAAVLTLCACGSSNTEEGSAQIETSTFTLESTESTYSIPDDAPTGVDGGPGVMETQATTANANYPEDKQYGETPSEGTLVCLYGIANYGMYQIFEMVTEVDADSLIEVMLDDNIIEGDVTVEAFSNEGGDAVLVLSEAEAGYDYASEEQLVTSIANTFIENLGLSTLTLTIGDTEYGTLSFDPDYKYVMP